MRGTRKFQEREGNRRQKNDGNSSYIKADGAEISGLVETTDGGLRIPTFL